ncbi:MULTISPECIES: methylated-DNA--[protein]-cysteine S-methyltransferase [unclassified Marinobacterium]|jgi:O-6-methylguanine DNA methyltransferase|uniref:methylated-DNA--[protein]-cysteine S-methyltransferase n=1 Tax=unclassified Marinobacterium TaxID=2644139 RepID=UPI0015680BEF|nr:MULTISPECIES: MGMT family protein [unclassified Marinobacterium]NRP09055.1 Bifunctional transcriptional activator/DNA repair enzyme Ada [Marinobacterium sp. xm-g-48]NRP15091.1 Bifunctional transcriptional activator/DNA repair enzyme Ada [Marinobacterium sp. xm-a-152]NRP35838.1 Bifunctional transcriptional activator/DNA repair enzyme Ada [Marinobacterium sp. xm-d-579]NRP39508.1 Bifunctional transcriptional activator/DNA repair enzyme Ada [Marinobacterium sp. xm-a-121]NRP82414.1 Bifunctional 
MIKLINDSDVMVSEQAQHSCYKETTAGLLKIVWCEQGILESSFVDAEAIPPNEDYCQFKQFILTNGGQLPLIVSGTDFQKAVWQRIAVSKVGEVLTYKQLAEEVGKPAAVRAVGSALGKNRHAYLIPCHRAVRSDGGLGGFRWGVERKSHLLTLEAGGLDLVKQILA